MIDEYRKYKESFNQFVEKFKWRNRYDLIGEYSAASLIPIIVIYIYYGEIKGFDDELLRKIKALCKFYDYDYDKIMEQVK